MVPVNGYLLETCLRAPSLQAVQDACISKELASQSKITRIPIKHLVYILLFFFTVTCSNVMTNGKHRGILCNLSVGRMNL